MAADWFPMTFWLTRRREVVTLASRCQRDNQWVVGALCDLWSWLSAESGDGLVADLKLADVSAAIGLAGFAEAVSTVGWLTEEAGGVRVSNWERWLSNSAKRRMQNTLRVQRQRNAAVTLASRKPSRSRRDKSVTTVQDSNTDNTPQPPATAGGVKAPRKRRKAGEAKPADGQPATAAEVPIPASLDTPDFRKAWFEEWLPNRADKRGTKIQTTVMAAQQQLRKLEGYGPAEGAARLRTALANQWQGVVFNGEQPPPAAATSPPPPPASAAQRAARLDAIDQPAGPMAGLNNREGSP